MRNHVCLAILLLAMLSGLYAFDYAGSQLSGLQKGITGAAAYDYNSCYQYNSNKNCFYLPNDGNCYKNDGCYSYDYADSCYYYDYNCAEKATGTSTASSGSTAATTSTAATNPIITSFTASPATIKQGEQTTLTWTGIENAAMCEIRENELSIANNYIFEKEFKQGTRTVKPEKTATYKLRCWYGEKETTKQATVTITATPTSTAATLPAGSTAATSSKTVTVTTTPATGTPAGGNTQKTGTGSTKVNDEAVFAAYDQGRITYKEYKDSYYELAKGKVIPEAIKKTMNVKNQDKSNNWLILSNAIYDELYYKGKISYDEYKGAFNALAGDGCVRKDDSIKGCLPPDIIKKLDEASSGEKSGGTTPSKDISGGKTSPSDKKKLYDACEKDSECASDICQAGLCVDKDLLRHLLKEAIAKSDKTSKQLKNGETCKTSSECASDICYNQKCYDKNELKIEKNDGEACKTNSECASRLCYNQKCKRQPEVY